MISPSPTGTSEAEELVKALRACANGVGSFKNARGDFGLCDEVANLIERMASALKPLADACDSGVHPDDADRSKLAVRVEYLRAARQALNHGRAEHG